MESEVDVGRVAASATPPTYLDPGADLRRLSSPVRLETLLLMPVEFVGLLSLACYVSDQHSQAHPEGADSAYCRDSGR